MADGALLADARLHLARSREIAQGARGHLGALGHQRHLVAIRSVVRALGEGAASWLLLEAALRLGTGDARCMQDLNQRANRARIA